MNELGLLLLKAFGIAILVYGMGCFVFLLGNRIYRSRQPLRIYAYLAEAIPPGQKALHFLRHTAYLTVLGLILLYLRRFF